MRGCYMPQFVLAFGEREIEPFFTALGTLDQKLERKCGFSGTRVPLNQIEKALGETAMKYIVQTRNSRGQTSLALSWHLNHFPLCFFFLFPLDAYRQTLASTGRALKR